MKNSACDSQGSGFTQLRWNEPMHKDGVVQDVSDIMSDIVVTEFPNQIKNE